MILAIFMAMGVIPAMFMPVNHPCQLSEFESVHKLEIWLEINPVNETKYYVITDDGWVKGDCDDYAIHLVEDARKDGYDLHFQIDMIGKRGHALNCAIIGNGCYFIEPQTDKVWRVGYLD